MINDVKKNIFDVVNPYAKIYFSKEGKFFGPGIARLLELVNEHKNLQKASVLMEMSYTKAWKIIKRAEKNLGIRLIKGQTGGVGGGSSELTKEGLDLLNKYNKMYDKIDIYVKKTYHNIFVK